MKKILLTVVATIIASTLVMQTSPLYTKQSQPPTGRTGAPNETKCNSCHNGITNSGNGSVVASFSDPSGKYIPGQTYQLTFTVIQSGTTRFGFEATALKSGNTQAGIFTVVNSSTTSIQSASGRQYVGHKNANANSNVSTWTVNWQAPTSNVGNVTVYATGVASNANGQDTGDNNYSTSIVIPCSWGLSVTPVDPVFADLNIVQTSATSLQLICNSTEKEKMNLQMFNLAGQQINQWQIESHGQGEFNETLSISSVEHGVYLFLVQIGNSSLVKKVIL